MFLLATLGRGHDCLLQGASTSSAFSNIVMKDFDRQIAGKYISDYYVFSK